MRAARPSRSLLVWPLLTLPWLGVALSACSSSRKTARLDALPDTPAADDVGSVSDTAPSSDLGPTPDAAYPSDLMPPADFAASGDIGTTPSLDTPASPDERSDHVVDAPAKSDGERTPDASQDGSDIDVADAAAADDGQRMPADGSDLSDVPRKERGSFWFSPPSIDFGYVAPNSTPPPQALIVTAKRDLVAVRLTTNRSPSNLTFPSQCGPLAAGESCTFEIIFHASDSTGSKLETLTIHATDSVTNTTYVPVTAQVQGPGQLVIVPSEQQTFYGYPNQPSPHMIFKVCNSGDTAMSLTVKTTGLFTAKATGCDPIAPGECCGIEVSGGSAFSTGSLDVSTSTPYPQSVSVPLVGVPVNM